MRPPGSVSRLKKSARGRGSESLAVWFAVLLLCFSVALEARDRQHLAADPAETADRAGSRADANNALGNIAAMLERARAAQWRRLGETSRLAMFIDQKSIGPLPSGEKRVLVKGIAYRPTPEQDYTIYEYYVRCDARKFALSAWVDLQDPARKTISEVIPLAEMEYSAPPEHGHAEELLRIACEPVRQEGTTQAVDFDAIRGAGTAWLSDRGVVIAAYHVVQGASKIWLAVEGRRAHTTLLAFDANADLAVLEMPPELRGRKGLPIGVSDAALGSTIFTIGYPHRDVMWTSPKFASGIVSRFARFGNDNLLFRLSAPVRSGHSGGPILNYRGEVVGIVSARLGANVARDDGTGPPRSADHAVKARQLRPLLPPSNRPGRTAPATLAASLEGLVARASPNIFLVVAE
ncbi:MAG: hypothetical protein A3H35_21280 [Betaproteobacteria bacterium RIFCSPLOWO2_02_FULL_62_17]|nr:MAG: hypothetical protein A3H35_21280 [Betaproteobacteria bacterium RIFCSPLOWO2_02_FULL_62_17]